MGNTVSKQTERNKIKPKNKQDKTNKNNNTKTLQQIQITNKSKTTL